MDHAVLLEHGIACADGAGLAVDGEGKGPRHHIGDLGVRVAVQRALRAGLKGVFDAHQPVGVGQDAPGDARPAALGQGVGVGDPALFLFGQRHRENAPFRTKRARTESPPAPYRCKSLGQGRPA